MKWVFSHFVCTKLFSSYCATGSHKYIHGFIRFQIAPNIQLSEEEIEYRQKQEYTAYLDEENTFLRELGLKDDDELMPET